MCKDLLDTSVDFTKISIDFTKSSTDFSLIIAHMMIFNHIEFKSILGAEVLFSYNLYCVT